MSDAATAYASRVALPEAQRTRSRRTKAPHVHVQLRRRPAREPRRHRVLRALRGADGLGRRHRCRRPTRSRETVPAAATRATWTRSSTARSRSSSRRRPTSRASSTRRSSSATACRARTSSTCSCSPTCSPSARASSSRADASRSTSRTSDASRTAASRPTSSASSRTTCTSCCAARSSGARAKGAAGNCAWGSFRSAANPVLRDMTERVVIASKGRFDRALGRAERERRGLPSQNTIDADEFMAATLDVWDIEPESARRVSHPAPFPVGLPAAADRPLHLRERPRARSVHGLGLDARRRGASQPALRRLRPRRHVRRHRAAARARRRRARRTRPTTSSRERRHRGSTTPTASRRARRKEGKAAQALAEELLTDTGFKIVAKNKRLPGTGVTINFIATDADDVEWYFDVSGAFTSTRGGLLRTDTVWKTLGRAHVLRGENLQGPLVFLTSHLPRKGSEGYIALKKVAEQGGFFDAIEMRSAEGYERLRKYAAGGQRRGRLRLPRLVADLKTADHRGRHRARNVRRRRRRPGARRPASPRSRTSAPTTSNGCSGRGRTARTATCSSRRS